MQVSLGSGLVHWVPNITIFRTSVNNYKIVKRLNLKKKPGIGCEDTVID